MNWRKLGDGFDYASPIQYNQEYRQVEMEKKAHESDSESENPQWEEESESGGRNNARVTHDSKEPSIVDLRLLHQTWKMDLQNHR